jgi:hypothetical protein
MTTAFYEIASDGMLSLDDRDDGIGITLKPQ